MLTTRRKSDKMQILLCSLLWKWNMIQRTIALTLSTERQNGYLESKNVEQPVPVPVPCTLTEAKTKRKTRSEVCGSGLDFTFVPHVTTETNISLMTILLSIVKANYQNLVKLYLILESL